MIILTDPDHAGERIRKIVSAKVPGCKHAFIPEKDATRKGDIGVENAFQSDSSCATKRTYLF